MMTRCWRDEGQLRRVRGIEFSVNYSDRRYQMFYGRWRDLVFCRSERLSSEQRGNSQSAMLLEHAPDVWARVPIDMEVLPP